LKLLAATERPATFRLPPPSSLLSRIESFLPEIAAANETLKGVSPEDRDIECVEEGVRHIEMNLQVVEDEGLRSEGESESETDGESETGGESDDIVIVDSDKGKDGLIVDMDVDR
jgi:hypothetical protein